MGSSQIAIDRANEAFWHELCGTTLARSVGVSDSSAASLARFDDAYLEMYPYLEDYIPADVRGRRVLEIGLGYGTLGGLLATRGADYHGLDIADGPVAMMRHRLEQLGVEDPQARVTRGSALEIPLEPESFDHVVTIGCLHHTGDVRRAAAEIHRVLRPGGGVVAMAYNRRSMRRLALAPRKRLQASRGVEEIRAAYDANQAGEAAPVTEFLTRRELARIFGRFSGVRVRSENFDEISLLKDRIRLPRRWFLGAPARLAGLDLYLTATK
jgi:ubiquinone/menaquinone biosynthesis C-methylase UbiE